MTDRLHSVRRAAIALAACTEADRQWLIARLPSEACAAVEAELQDLAAQEADVRILVDLDRDLDSEMPAKDWPSELLAALEAERPERIEPHLARWPAGLRAAFVGAYPWTWARELPTTVLQGRSGATRLRPRALRELAQALQMRLGGERGS